MAERDNCQEGWILHQLCFRNPNREVMLATGDGLVSAYGAPPSKNGRVLALLPAKTPIRVYSSFNWGGFYMLEHTIQGETAWIFVNNLPSSPKKPEEPATQ